MVSEIPAKYKIGIDVTPLPGESFVFYEQISTPYNNQVVVVVEWGKSYQKPDGMQLFWFYFAERS